MITHAVQTLSRGSIDRFDWIDELPIFEDLVTAIASQDMKVMRAGFVPWGVNPSSSGHSGFTSGTVAWGGSGATVGNDTSNDGGAITARPHGDIQPLRLPPPWHGSENVSGGSQTIDPELVAMSGGSGGSGGGDPPVAVDDYYSGLHDVGMTVADNGVLWNDYLGSEPGVPSLVSSPSHDLSFSFSQGGGFTYTPPANWAGNDSFTYTITNSSGTSDPATVTIAITNNAPVAGLDSYAAITNTELVIPSSRWPGVEGVLANDADADGDDFTVSWNDQPQHGAVTVASDGSFEYVPETGYQGLDSFNYTISDGIDTNEEQFVNINVYRFVVDLDTDSDNNGVIEGTLAEDNVEMDFPGKIIAKNTNDDNGNLVQDLAEAPLMAGDPPSLFQDDDLFPIAIAVETAIPQTNGFTFEITVDPELKLWKDPAKEYSAQLSYTTGTDEVPLTLYVEGYDTGTGTIAGVLKNNAGTVVNQDSVQFLIVEMDIDTDSDNTTEVDQTVSEDLKENRPGNDKFEVGKRIFENVDDDNKNGERDRDDSKSDYANHGLSDKDFAEVRLGALGVSGLEGYSLWLGLPRSVHVWGEEDKSFFAYDDWDIDFGSGGGVDSWYIWNIGPSGASLPPRLYFEGLLQGSAEVDWRLVKPSGSGFDGSGDILAQDTIEINIEQIVWPNQDPSVSWDPDEPTVDWNGFVLGEGWFIEESLGDIKNGSTGYIRTEYPQEVEYPAEDPNDPPLKHWEGTINQNDSAVLDLNELCGTANWDETVRIELTYEFEQSPNIPVGDFVDTNLANRWQASFFHNSGVKIENRAEIQIFDTASLLDAIDGSQETLDDATVNVIGDVNEINTVGYVKLHYGDPPVYSTVKPADYVNALISGIPYGWNDKLLSETYVERLQRAPMGAQTMTIDVARDANGDYDFTVTIDSHTNDPPYHVVGGEGAADGMLYLQSHWGSGVKFISAKVKEL